MANQIINRIEANVPPPAMVDAGRIVKVDEESHGQWREVTAYAVDPGRKLAIRTLLSYYFGAGAVTLRGAGSLRRKMHQAVSEIRHRDIQPMPELTYHRRLTVLTDVNDIRPYVRYAATTMYAARGEMSTQKVRDNGFVRDVSLRNELDLAKLMEGNAIRKKIDEAYDFRYTPLESIDFQAVSANIEKDKIGYVTGYVDRTTGLHFKVLFDAKRNEVVVAFGASGSRISCLVRDVELVESPFRALQLAVAQDQLLGETPAAYEQASSVVQYIKAHVHAWVQSTAVEGAPTIVTTGHCFGGSLAAYAALDLGLQAYCFNTLPLGVGLQNKLGFEKLAKAETSVQNISVKGDYTSDAKSWLRVIHTIASLSGLGTPNVLGQRYAVGLPDHCHYDKRKVHGNVAHLIFVAAGIRDFRG